jgi:GntR family transcriptional regulator, trigonelline degradation regulator
LASGDAMTTLPELRIARDLPTLRDLTTDKLREAIMAQRFKPGQHLVERDLCEQTGVSRSSVREALRHLEAEGLVERRGNRGLFVASITPDEARQIYEVRAAIEPEMARLFAARATEDDLAALSATLTALEHASRSRVIADYVRALDAFFDTLIGGTRNEVAVRIVRTLRARISYLRGITTGRAEATRQRETIKLMRDIAECARRRDGEAIHRQCRSFIERSAAFAIEVLNGEPHQPA